MFIDDTYIMEIVRNMFVNTSGVPLNNANARTHFWWDRNRY